MTNLRLRGFTGLLAITLSALAFAAQPSSPPAASSGKVPVLPETLANQSPLTEQLAALSDHERTYHQHVTTLSSPFFEGRAPGTRGNQLAAEYLEFYFKAAGLKPGIPASVEGGEASFMQPFQAGSEIKAATQRVAFASPNMPPVELKPGTDFNVLGTSGDGSATGTIAFVGYGIQDGPNGYSTFKDENLEGRIAMLLRFEPMDEQGRSKWGKGNGWTGASALRGKLQTVADRKPAAIVLVNPPGADDPRVGRLETIRTSQQGRALSIPIIMVSVEQAEEMVKIDGKTLMGLRKEADERGGVTVLPGARVSLDVAVKREPNKTQNVVGVLPGKGALAEQYIVIGAHYDHLGYGYFGSRAGQRAAGTLHPGADDNASGTAGLLMTAQIMAERYAAMPAGASARSIVFIGFSGEESGLLGSAHFIRNTPIKAEQVTAMLNMDMIGRVRFNKMDLTGTGSAEGFDDLLQPLIDASGLTVRKLPGGSGPSDHATFYRANIPVLAFFSGIHRQYHMPEDFWWTVNTPGAMKVVDLAVKTAEMIVMRPEPLKFTTASGPGVSFDDPSETETAKKDEPAGDMQAPRAGPVRIRFGIAPGTYDDDKPGVEIGDVYAGTSAAEAGLKTGDRLTKWNGQEIKGVEDWMPMLSKHKPGDKVEIVYVRDGQEITATCTLKARDQGDR